MVVKEKTGPIQRQPISFGGDAGCYSLSDMIMDKEEQISCVLEYQRTGEEHLKTRIIGSVLNYVIESARQYAQYSGVPLKDLVQEGVLGVMVALDRYDRKKAKDASFLSYASWWIKNRIRRHSYKYQYVVSPPASYIGGKNAEGESRRLSIKDELSLNTPCGEDGNGELIDIMAAPEDELSGTIFDPDIKDRLLEIIGSMDGRDIGIVKLRFGLSGNPPMTLDSIAKKVGLTRERIRQIVDRKILEIRRII